MKQKNDSFFWTSYSDLMTSLFFIMLVLFVLTVILLFKRMTEIKRVQVDTQEELDQIKTVNESVKDIDSTYFFYNDEFKRHTLKIAISFQSKSAERSDIPQEKLDSLEKAGKSLCTLIEKKVKEFPEAQYLLIVEGQSSKDTYQYNYQLSYDRALTLVKFWNEKKVLPDQKYCEVIISGSGHASLFREQPDEPGNQANQRFVIHIIPKPGMVNKVLNEKRH